MYDFHNLETYKKAREINKEILILIKGKNIEQSIKNQLTRASLSILLNIAEGSGRQTPNDKKRFYIICRGSIYECIALIDVLLDFNYINKEKYQQLYNNYEELTKMIFGLIKSLS